MRIILSTVFTIVCLGLSGQNSTIIKNDSATQQLQFKKTILMLKSISEKGICLSKDSIVISDEFQKILNDSTFFNSIYPETYTWKQALIYIQNLELKKAFWYFINLYDDNETNKKLVVQSVLTYNTIVQMDKVLVNTFYTYAFADPEISTIVNKKPNINHPDVLEAKLQVVKEMVQYINYYKQKDTNNKY